MSRTPLYEPDEVATFIRLQNGPALRNDHDHDGEDGCDNADGANDDECICLSFSSSSPLHSRSQTKGLDLPIPPPSPPGGILIDMCAPGTKTWHRYATALQLNLATAFLIAICSAYWLACSQQYNIDTRLQYKEYVSHEALHEIEGLQNYVASLASHELSTGHPVYTEAAFDLASSDPLQVIQGIEDWRSFMAPTQAHIHDLVSQSPIAWGTVNNSIPILKAPLLPKKLLGQRSAGNALHVSSGARVALTRAGSTGKNTSFSVTLSRWV